MISKNEKIKLLKKLLEYSETVKVENSSDPEFKTWKNLVERTFIKIFGKNSTEFEHFSLLEYHYPAMIFTETSDYTAQHLQAFRQSFKMIKNSIDQYIEEAEDELTNQLDEVKEALPKGINKVFISHSSSDHAVVEEVVELLESIGLESTQIFCTSFAGYGIGLGENFLDKIREELSSDTLVLFLLSENFYKSAVCLCEMGATWVLAKEHIPILIPPLDYNDLKGVIPLTQGLKIDEGMNLNLLKEKIETLFGIENKLSMSTWERKRDRIIGRVRKSLEEIEGS